MIKQSVRLLVKVVIDLLLLLPAMVAALASRFVARPVDIGLGPEPLVSYKYHKQSLALVGYVAETYVVSSNYITSDFDHNADEILPGFFKIIRWHYLFFRALSRYRCLYFSFHGGPLMGTIILRQIEPHLLRLAGIKTVILPYGSDVQDMTRCPNLSFVAAVSTDYPMQRSGRNRISRQIDRWTRHANHIVSGCDWVDYMYHWDTITLNNFSIDTDYWTPSPAISEDRIIRILHSPNHCSIKGTSFFTKAIRELKEEGVDVELVVLEKASNEVIRKEMPKVDIVADQLIIGWYAMFAMEGMASGKPVLCNIRRDLKVLYTRSGLLETDELPLVECTPENIKEVLRSLIADRRRMEEIGKKSRSFVEKHHSLSAISISFDRINKSISIFPGCKTEEN